jgi:hypothetical protein
MATDADETRWMSPSMRIFLIGVKPLVRLP